MDKKKIIMAVCAVGVVACIAAGTAKVKATSETADSTKQTDTETTTLTKEQEASLDKFKETYDVSNQQEISQGIKEQKKAKTYTADNMLTIYNPFGTNTQSLYIYFHTEEAVSVEYTVHVEDDSISDFHRSVYQEDTYQKEHEFQVIGLIPDMENRIIFTLTEPDGTIITKEIVYEMGSLAGTEEVKLNVETAADAEELEDGLYVILGNDSTALDFMYYYDNQGVLRGEVPLLGYRSHRLIFDEDSMYYSISETKMAQVNRIGEVVGVYDLGNYELHHDYVFDDDGDMLILASDTEQDTVEDIIVRLDTDSGEVEEVLDLEELFGSYKELCERSEDEELDWMHINTIQWMGDDSVLLSSRETSSIIKIDDIYDSPSIAYIIGEDSFWEDTEYAGYVLDKEGDFTIQGGQHAVTYVKDESLKDEQYYLYMFNNNIGVSSTNPDYDWDTAGLTEDKAKEGEASYYYEYLVDEGTGSFELVDSFEVPYSGYVSSAQNIGDNTIMDSGFAGTFAEYDEDHELIASYKMNVEKFIYRVFKYDFEGFYF